MSLWAVIAFILGLIMGLLVAWYYWRGRISEQEARSHSLQAALHEKERSVQILRANLKRHEADVKRLQDRVSQSEERAQELTAHAED